MDYIQWPDEIQTIYDKALKDLGGNMDPLHFGPAHIVWEDDNFMSAQWCLNHFDEYTDELSPEQCAIVKKSLEDLRDLPDHLKEDNRQIIGIELADKGYI